MIDRMAAQNGINNGNGDPDPDYSGFLNSYAEFMNRNRLSTKE